MSIPLTPQQIAHYTEVLNSSTDSAELYAAATRLAASATADAILALGRAMRKPQFYARLDQLDHPQLRRANLHGIFAVLREHPSVFSGKLCTFLASDPAFLDDSARLALLLPALAAATPMTAEAAAVFRQTNAKGYFPLNGPLLLANGSPEAVALFEEMVADESAHEEDRVAMIRTAIVPLRCLDYVVAACDRLLNRNLPPAIETGLIESLFDFREREWFGVAKHAPAPPAWAAASTESIRIYLRLAQRLQATGRLSEEMSSTMQTVTTELEAILRERANGPHP